MRSNKYYIVFMMLVMLVTCVSCRQELCYDHYPTMDLKFLWEQEWERDYGMGHKAKWDPALHRYEYEELRPDVPEWVKMVKYHDDGRTSEHFFTPEGKKFEVEEGEDCSILFYNGDTEYIILSDVASLHDVRATATTRTRASNSLHVMQQLYQESRTTNPPDVIYSAYIDHVPGVKVHELRDMPVKMQPLVYTYLITFEFEYGIEKVAIARGALGGMAEGVYLRTGVTTEEASIILFDCGIDSEGCRSQVRSFGVPGFPDSYFGRSATGTDKPFSLNLECRLKNGKTVDFDFDITDQMKNQPRGGVIRVRGIRIEDEVAPSEPTSGFKVDLSDWDDNAEVINIPTESFTST